MKDITPEAIVTRVTTHPTYELAEGVEVSPVTVTAKMYVPAQKYLNDIYLVRVLKPGLDRDPPKQGRVMEHGEFQFDAGLEIKIGDRFEISVTPIP
jgi:hypothetical protein